MFIIVIFFGEKKKYTQIANRKLKISQINQEIHDLTVESQSNMHTVKMIKNFQCRTVTVNIFNSRYCCQSSKGQLHCETEIPSAMGTPLIKKKKKKKNKKKTIICGSVFFSSFDRIFLCQNPFQMIQNTEIVFISIVDRSLFHCD